MKDFDRRKIFDDLDRQSVEAVKERIRIKEKYEL